MMKKRMLFVLMMSIFVLSSSYAQWLLFPDSETAKSEVELGVEGIRRLCPTGMWDHWTLRDILYDREEKMVLMIIQLPSWGEWQEESVSKRDAEAESKWIVANFKIGYEYLTANPRIFADGDFMLYLSVGTLLKQMERDGIDLRIMLLKPDYRNQVFGDVPLQLSAEELKEVKAEK